MSTYTPFYPSWHNLPATDTALDAAALQHYDAALATVFADAASALAQITTLEGQVGTASGLATLGTDGILTTAQRPPSSGGGGTSPLYSPLGMLLGGI